MSLPEAASQSLAVLSRAGRQNPSTIRAKHRVIETILMRKRGDGPPRHWSPELGGIVPTYRQDPCTIRTKRTVRHLILMGKRGDEFSGGRIPQLSGFVPA